MDIGKRDERCYWAKGGLADIVKCRGFGRDSCMWYSAHQLSMPLIGLKKREVFLNKYARVCDD